MSGPAAQFKAFAYETVGSWFNQKWKDKLAAGFTVSGTPSGDKLVTLQFFQGFAMSHGMLWVSLGELPGQPNGVNRLGSWIGVMAEDSGNFFMLHYGGSGFNTYSVYSYGFLVVVMNYNSGK